MQNAVKKVKFSNPQINEFFEFINSVVKAPIFRDRFHPVNGIYSFNHPENVKNKVTDVKFNAYGCFNAGNTYDRYDEGRIRSDEERLAEVTPRIKKALQDIQRALNAHPIFNNIEIKDVTKTYSVIITREDRFDDGNDEFGVQVFWKCVFKK